MNETETPGRVLPVQTPLTLIMTIKSEQDYLQLRQMLEHFHSLPDTENPVRVALNRVATVHFARFVFLENNTKLAIITTYDGDFDTYINDFIEQIADVFNALFTHMEDAPPLPVQTYRKEFGEYIKKNDVPCIQPFYSAYPRLTVLDIQALSES
ncbi:MAG: hypothetical protein V4671_07405 [Armatimonadota bacterium]